MCLDPAPATLVDFRLSLLRILSTPPQQELFWHPVALGEWLECWPLGVCRARGPVVSVLNTNYQNINNFLLSRFRENIRGVHVGHNWDETDFEN